MVTAMLLLIMALPLFAASELAAQKPRIYTLSASTLDSLKDESVTYMYIDTVFSMPLGSGTGREWLNVQWPPSKLVVRLRRANVRNDGADGVDRSEIELSGTVVTSETQRSVVNAFVSIGRRFSMTGRLMDANDQISDDTSDTVPYIEFLPHYSVYTDSLGRFRMKALIAEDSWLMISHERFNVRFFDVGWAVRNYKSLRRYRK